jgi:hypothetical protein
MSAETVQASGARRASPGQIGEWFWRFLAVVMLVVIGWVVWIAIQISPPEMVLPAAYEAAAQGRASRSSGGAIGVAGAAVPAPASADQAATAVPAPSAPVPVVAAEPVKPAKPAEPPVNLEKLRMADTIETPIFERARRGPKPAADASQ